MWLSSESIYAWMHRMAWTSANTQGFRTINGNEATENMAKRINCLATESGPQKRWRRRRLLLTAVRLTYADRRRWINTLYKTKYQSNGLRRHTSKIKWHDNHCVCCARHRYAWIPIGLACRRLMFCPFVEWLEQRKCCQMWICEVTATCVFVLNRK